ASRFSALGLSPGISDNGQIVTFYANLTDAGRDVINPRQQGLLYADGSPLSVPMLSSGPGIFASVRVNGATKNGTPLLNSRLILRIAGVDAVNGPFSSFSADDRVGVNSTQLTQRAVTIVYIASDNSTPPKKGIYTSRLEFLP